MAYIYISLSDIECRCVHRVGKNFLGVYNCKEFLVEIVATF